MIPTLDTTKVAIFMAKFFVLVSVLTLIYSLLPYLSLPAEISASLAFFVDLVFGFDAFFPIRVFFQLVSYGVLLEISFLIFRLLLWLAAHFTRSND